MNVDTQVVVKDGWLCRWVPPPVLHGSSTHSCVPRPTRFVCQPRRVARSVIVLVVKPSRRSLFAPPPQVPTATDLRRCPIPACDMLDVFFVGQLQGAPFVAICRTGPAPSKLTCFFGFFYSLIFLYFTIFLYFFIDVFPAFTCY